MRHRALLILIPLLVGLWPGVAGAQSASALLTQGIRAYELREYDGGAWLLRRALAAQGSDALRPADAARALAYLAATELERDQRDSALAASRRVFQVDPNFRPDERAFPPQVVALFRDARRGTPASAPAAAGPVAPAGAASAVIAIRALGDTTIRPGADAYTMRLTANRGAATELTATLAGPDGRIVRTLFTGPVQGTVDLQWNGLDRAGAPAPVGGYTLIVTPVGRDRRAGWALRLPLEVTRAAVDTLALPPAPADSLYRPERGNPGRAWDALAPGVLAGAAIVVLPELVAQGEEASSARLLIGGTVTIAGIAAFLSNRPGRSIPANRGHNRDLRERWRRDVADITRRNADLLRGTPLIIRAGEPQLTTGEAP